MAFLGEMLQGIVCYYLGKAAVTSLFQQSQGGTKTRTENVTVAFGVTHQHLFKVSCRHVTEMLGTKVFAECQYRDKTIRLNRQTHTNNFV